MGRTFEQDVTIERIRGMGYRCAAFRRYMDGALGVAVQRKLRDGILCLVIHADGRYVDHDSFVARDAQRKRQRGRATA